MIALIGLPCAAKIVATAQPLVATLFGAQWQVTVELTRGLGIYALSSILMANQDPVLLALGRSRLVSMLIALGVAMLAPAFVLGYRLGELGGAVIAVSAVNVVLWVVRLTVTLRVVEVAPLELLRPTWRAMIGTMVMVTLMWPLADGLAARDLAPAINLLACVVAGALAYLFVVGSPWMLVGRPLGPEHTVCSFLLRRRSRHAGGSQ